MMLPLLVSMMVTMAGSDPGLPTIYPSYLRLNTQVKKDIMFTCKVKSEDKPLVFWSFRNRTIQSHNDRASIKMSDTEEGLRVSAIYIQNSLTSMSGVTIMILIILLITILMSYVLYCDTDTNPDLISIADNMVTNLTSPSVILTDPECQNIKSPESFQPGLDCEARIPRIVVSTVSPEPCPSDTSDTTCTSIQSDSSQSSAAS